MSILRSLVLTGSVLSLAAAFSLPAFAAPTESVTVNVHQVSAEGVGKSIGTITIEQGTRGLTFTPKLTGLPPGSRGFHIHQNPSCEPKEKDGKMAAAVAAGDHFDPSHTGHHAGPEGAGHAGDLPSLTVGPDGFAHTPVTAPKLKLSDVAGRSVMIHAGGDNYSDTPAPLGGGGARIACGVIPAK